MVYELNYNRQDLEIDSCRFLNCERRKEKLPPKINMFNKKFGYLTVVSDAIKKENSKDLFYTCLCDCGNIKNIRGISLRTGETKSCGCMSKAIRNDAKKFIGVKYGRLIPFELLEKRSNNNELQYNCQCDCGNTTIVSASKLKNGNTKSCGCLKKEKGAENIHNWHIKNVLPVEQRIINKKNYIKKNIGK